MKKLFEKYLNKELQHIKEANANAPFPLFDTEYVEQVEKKLNEVKSNDYNDEPVEACGACGSLYIQDDELKMNHVCMRCGAENNLIKYDHIDDYLNSEKGKFWNKQ